MGHSTNEGVVRAMRETEIDKMLSSLTRQKELRAEIEAKAKERGMDPLDLAVMLLLSCLERK